jgi:DNA-binding response OmpR family regulator
MPDILLVADEAWIVNDVRAALDAHTITVQPDPRAAAEAWIEGGHDVVVVDLQVGSMGGMAVTRSVRDAAALAGRPHPPVVVLLDRDADAFLAKRAGATAWLRKPFGSFDLRELVERLGAGASAGEP